MSQITLRTFKQAVALYFEPLVREQGWTMIRHGDNVYESASPFFIMRIRFEIGAHKKGINVTLLPVDKVPGDIDDGSCGELGVRVLAGYNGVEIEYIPSRQTEAGFFAEAQYVANMTTQFGLPYLLGQRSDWNNVKEYIEAQTKKRAEEIRGYRFPLTVQKRWHLSPPQSDDKKI